MYYSPLPDLSATYFEKYLPPFHVTTKLAFLSWLRSTVFDWAVFLSSKSTDQSLWLELFVESIL